MNHLLQRTGLLAMASALLLSIPACSYDPYLAGPPSYGSGFGEGYGYGGSQFNTSVFVSTGNPRWGYDPYCQSYFDYHRHCYYDPYLHGYYPIGYRPPVLVGCPHPFGWRPGRAFCPPPTIVRNVTVVNYRNREAAYRSSRYDWARQVRQRPVHPGRVEDSRTPRRDSFRADTDRRPFVQQGRPARPDQAIRPHGSTYRDSPRRDERFEGPGGGSRQQIRPSQRPGMREQPGARVPYPYNTPVTRNQSHRSQGHASAGRQQQERLRQPDRQAPSSRNRPEGRRMEQRPPRQEERPSRQSRGAGRSEESRPIRGLGQGA